MGKITNVNESMLSGFRDLIEKRLGELAQDLTRGVAGTKTVELDQQSIGRLNRQYALLGQAVGQAQQAMGAQEVTRLKVALARIENEEFGWCENCGDAITPKRLELDPAAIRCIDCASG